MSEAELESDDLANQLCQKINDLQSEKMALLDANDALAAENIALRNELAEAKQQLFTMRGA